MQRLTVVCLAALFCTVACELPHPSSSLKTGRRSKEQRLSSFFAFEEGDIDVLEADDTILMQVGARVDRPRGPVAWTSSVMQVVFAIVLLLPALIAYAGLGPQSLLGSFSGLRGGEASAPSRSLQAAAPAETAAAPVAAAPAMEQHAAEGVPDSVVDAIMEEDDALLTGTHRLQTKVELQPAEKDQPAAPAASALPTGVTDEMVDSFLEEASSEAANVGTLRLQTGLKKLA
eukprot:TRINITY_DN21860_c0_g1_i1.p1 TRINITY_DN21860_c0_g1~~TRINITY_DN21860_c0_g1_i1.p1  ORF type:complete len:231 (-),score=72.83 TRINITY_DN21860_c0_g1_i1:75-767(-)